MHVYLYIYKAKKLKRFYIQKSRWLTKSKTIFVTFYMQKTWHLMLHRFSWAVIKGFPLRPPDVFRVGWCFNRVIWWSWRTTDCLIIPKPRLSAQFDRDARTEGWDLLLDIYHESQKGPLFYGHEGPVRYIGKMHGHVSVRSERVCLGALWVKFEPGCSNPNSLGQKDCNDVRGADQS